MTENRNQESVSKSRRRFTRAGLSGSVLMTLASRPALANHCSVSGTMSGNLSRPDGGVQCVGLTPGFWKTHPEPEYWGCGYVAGLCNPLTSTNGQCSDYDFVTYGELQTAYDNGDISYGTYNTYLNWANWTAGATDPAALPAPSVPPTTLNSAFSGSGLSFSPNSDGTPKTMMQAFWDPPEDYDPQTLVAHAAAALLNACRFGEEAFGYTGPGLIQFIANWEGSFEGLKDALAMLNERGV